jgi:hypothetical protein
MSQGSQSFSALLVGIIVGMTTGAAGTALVYERAWLGPSLEPPLRREPPRPALPTPPTPTIEVVSLAPPRAPVAPDAGPPSTAPAVPFSEQPRVRAWARPQERELKSRLARHLSIRPIAVECRESCCRIDLRPEVFRAQHDALLTDMGLSGRWTVRTESAGSDDEAASLIVCDAPLVERQGAMTSQR